MALDFTGISNVGEFYSHHYLSALLEGDLKATFRAWSQREKDGGPRAPHRRLAGLATRYFEAAGRAEGRDEPEDRWTPAREFHAHLLDALGYPYQPVALPLDDGSVLPALLSLPRDGRPWLWIVDAPFPRSGDAADPLGERPFPAQLPPEAQSAKLPPGTWAELLDGPLFRQAEPPRWVLLLAGSDTFLIDRHKWGQGKYLHFDLSELFGRRQTPALRATAGLLHREILAPHEGPCLHDTLDEASHKHAFAVSGDLKHGVRRAVELIANEALWYKRTISHEKVYGDEDLARTLTGECLTWLYRLLFLFYVEARGEDHGVVPMKSDTYRLGYSLEALRDLELVPLHSEAARQGFYIHDSLRKLFHLVNRGHLHRGAQELDYTECGLHHTFTVQPQRSQLFDPEHTPTLSAVRLRNGVLQQVLQLLSLSAVRHGHDRGRISYAQLGINQLGAVYEGLLAYSGFFAQEDLAELRHPAEMNDPEARSYFVPVTDLDRFDAKEIVHGEDGRPLTYPRGSFVFRLAGRDREKSASYYTPEVLTRCLVKYTLEERLKGLAAADLLKLTVCEPAMGSGAFLNEAVNQLADAYLERKQAELGQTLAAEDYALERQKVKHHLAANNCYGVDLNALATKLAKVSLWLNVLHAGARAPYLDLRLAVGNSLIGARRTVFRSSDLTVKGSKKHGANWLGLVPERVAPGAERPRGAVYHFLLPDAGMAPFDRDKVVKGLEPEAVARIKAWRKEFCRPFGALDLPTLERLSARIDKLWAEHTATRLEVATETRQHVGLWGQSEAPPARSLSVEECAEHARRLDRPHSAGVRLHAVMDYWCALWFWPLRHASLPPSREEWLLEVEALLESQNVPGLMAELPRLRVVRDVCRRVPFFHWELQFAEVFAQGGGFDVILGNPPWVKLEWKEAGVLSDFEPKLELGRLSAKQVADLRAEVMGNPQARRAYFEEFEAMTASGRCLNALQAYPLLMGVQTNLYKAFVASGFRWMSPAGVCGIVHQKGMYDDPRGGKLRAHLAWRLAAHLHFVNKLVLFESIEDQKHYEISVFRGSKNPKPAFAQVSNLFHPRTLDDSIAHDGHGPVPGIKDEAGHWDLRGHRSRIVEVDEETLALFAALYDPPGTPALEARLPVVHSQEILEVLRKFRRAPRRLGDLAGEYYSTEHFHETNQQKDGTIRRETRFPATPAEWVLSGPHFFVGTPLNKTPNEGCRHNQDYSALDLEALPDDYLPRTNFVPACDAVTYAERTPHWRGRPVTDFFRHINRQMVAPTGERTHVAAIIPPGPAHTGTAFSITFARNAEMATYSALSASIPVDFFVKASGKNHVIDDVASILPLPALPPAVSRVLVARALRLNCLTTHYAPLWAELWDPACREDSFTKDDPRLPIWSDLTPTWQRHCALRTPYARRQALVELDALAALALGLSADELCLIYRVQFPVLQQYERETFYDRRGRIVFTVNKGLSVVGLARKEWEEVRGAGEGAVLPEWAADGMGAYVAPFDRCDREEDMRGAYLEMERRLH